MKRLQRISGSIVSVIKIWSYFLLFGLILLVAGCAGHRLPVVSTPVSDVSQNAYVQGMGFVDNSQYDEALKSFEGVLDLDPTFEPAYAGICLAYTGKGDYKLAEENVNRALSLNKRNPAPYVAYGRMLVAQREFKKALKKFNKAIKIDPLCAEAFYYKGEIYEKWGKYREARISYKNALAVDSNYSKASVAWEKLQGVE